MRVPESLPGSITLAKAIVPSSSLMRPSLKDCASLAAEYSAFSDRSPCARASSMSFTILWRKTSLRRLSSPLSWTRPRGVMGIFDWGSAIVSLLLSSRTRKKADDTGLMKGMPDLLRGALPLVLLLVPSSVGATRFEVGPFLQDARADGVTVVWETDRPALGEVVVTTSVGEQRFPSTGPAGTHQVVRVGGLPPGRFAYRVIAGDATSPAAQLATATQSDHFTFLVYGDNRDRDVEHARVVAAMVGEHADLA